jgi:hypothetical protein
MLKFIGVGFFLFFGISDAMFPSASDGPEYPVVRAVPHSERLQFKISCENLPNVDHFGKSDPYVVVSRFSLPSERLFPESLHTKEDGAFLKEVARVRKETSLA